MDVRERIQARLAKHQPKASSWYEIKNADGGDDEAAVVRIYDEIGFWGVTAEDFARDVAAIAADEIVVQISSPGGSVFDGIAIYNALRAHDARVTTRVDGIAASVASVIVQAGDHRVMMSGSQMMIHEAWGLAIGSAADMREFADLLDRQNDVVVGIYASRSGGDAEEIRTKLAEGDTWLTADETVDMGFADEVADPAPKSKSGDAKAALPDSIDLDDLVARIAERLTQTPPAADGGEETDGGVTAAVTRAEAERLRALFTIPKKETDHE